VKLEPVTSSNIAAVGYDHATRTLGVQFKSGGTYHYHDVSPEEHRALVSADSIGSHFHQHIRSGKRVSKQ
jgi:hypothetical protein